MKSQKIADSVKNAVSTVFLLAGAFFVCSTLLSMRSVLADPIAPVDANMLLGPQSGRRDAATARAPGRTSPRNSVSRTTVARTAVPGGVTNVVPAAGRGNTVTSRAVTSRAATNRADAAAGRVNSNGSRNVVSRKSAVTTRANATQARSVRARTATTDMVSNARVSLQGSAIRGSKSAPSSSYSYLSGKLYTGNYSNIIDSTTGLISTDAFNNCLESYYTCMDEICTARNAAQRRCACAGRVRAFAEAETALETANEELIKVSGELALLIANKGKDVSEAFQLTDAEKVMNCVSWQDVTNKYGVSSDEAIDWCYNHNIYGSDGGRVSSCAKPSYCSESGNDFGFDVSNLDGSGSDILASLQAWADAKEQTLTIVTDNTDTLLSAFDNLSSVVSGMAGIDGALSASDTLTDSLAETWGYELFEYAHNNVCARVLDSCFNGIFEACGTPPSGTKCSNGASQCPYNYNSHITVNNTGTYELNFVNASSGYSASNSATCFGYTSASGDPYSSLRGPVADARRSIMQKYALDANADCDAYGEQLRATAQNIGYQKVAAQQALQQKRLEFAQEESASILSAAIQAGTNFNECISEILDCYETQVRANSGWTTARIKTYCAQIANVPHCYEEMICNPSTAQFKAIIDKPDSKECLNAQDYATNTCRNIVTLNEILNGTGAGADHASIPADGVGSSVAMREQCLLDAGALEVRNWSVDLEALSRCSLGELPDNASSGLKAKGDTTCTKITACNNGYMLVNNECILASTDCTNEIANAAQATRELNQSNHTWGKCIVTKCKDGYNLSGNQCTADVRDCSAQTLYALDPNAKYGTQTWSGTGYATCVISECRTGYSLVNGANKCTLTERDCSHDDMVAADPNATQGIQKWTDSGYTECIITECAANYRLNNGKCKQIDGTNEPTGDEEW